jgi:autotransporter-associated beta strand protein
MLGENGGTLGAFGAHRIEGAVTGPGTLHKTGPGSLTLAGPLLHTGAVEVHEGVLLLTNPSLADGAPLVIHAGASIHLAHAAGDEVGSLVLGGVTQPSGTYHEGNSAGFITGSGSITVRGPAGYAGWIQAEFPGITDVNVIGFNKDPDGDDLPNGIEFVLGTKPGGPTPPEHRPQLVATPDAVTFIFRRTAASAALQPTAQFATDPAGPWTPAVHGSGGVTIADQANGFGDGIDRVTVSIPVDSATRLFVRLSITES